MGTIGASEEINQHRRQFFGAAAMTVAAAQLGMASSASAYSHRLIEGGVGHNLPQEAPKAFADAVLELMKAS
jgi:pimeloyl-ACP methyl ester carboxylesterase